MPAPSAPPSKVRADARLAILAEREVRRVEPPDPDLDRPPLTFPGVDRDLDVSNGSNDQRVNRRRRSRAWQVVRPSAGNRNWSPSCALLARGEWRSLGDAGRDATCVAMHDLRKRLCAQAFCVTAGHAFNLPSDLSVTCHASILTTDAKPRCCIRLSGAPLQAFWLRQLSAMPNPNRAAIALASARCAGSAWP